MAEIGPVVTRKLDTEVTQLKIKGKLDVLYHGIDKLQYMMITDTT